MDADRIDPEAWLLARGWHRYEGAVGVYWRKTPNEAGWEGGWNTAGAVGAEIRAAEVDLLTRMRLYVPPSRKARKRS